MKKTLVISVKQIDLKCYKKCYHKSLLLLGETKVISGWRIQTLSETILSVLMFGDPKGSVWWNLSKPLSMIWWRFCKPNLIGETSMADALVDAFINSTIFCLILQLFFVNCMDFCPENKITLKCCVPLIATMNSLLILN